MITSFILIAHIIGLLNALHALFYSRTAQGAIAWIIALITFPYLTVPLYWLTGRHRFSAYVAAHRQAIQKHRRLAEIAQQEIGKYAVDVPTFPDVFRKDAQLLIHEPFTDGNRLDLLKDGPLVYQAMEDAIEAAKDYVLFQFYIIAHDETGIKFRDLLTKKAREGCRIYLLYDQMGCLQLPGRYFQPLAEAGVRFAPFDTSKAPSNRWQYNFRNHRKVVVTDGRVGILGGLNISDNHLSKNPRYGHWRDTAIQLHGPSVQCLQLSFVYDWYWSRQEIPALEWQPETFPENEIAMIWPTGPADQLNACKLGMITLINRAQKRFWITSPYFVPDEGIMCALQSAALRGVDVRVLLPSRTDHLLVWLSSYSFYSDLEDVGIKLFRYKPGFMHQKVFLLDDQLAGVGTMNLDNRSLSINFELTALIQSTSFIAQVETMLKEDFDNSFRVDLQEYQERSLLFKTGVQLARLMSPLL